MTHSKLKAKRIVLMAIPAIIFLSLVVAIPIIGGKVDKNRDRLSKIHSEKLALYEARLESCPEFSYQPEVESFPLAPGEVSIEISPSFDPSQGIRISKNSVRGYSGPPGSFFPPPPPPPPSQKTSQFPQQEPAKTSRIELMPPVQIDPALGKHLLRVLKTEIDHADAKETLGLDGTTYILRYGNKCATTWSPEPRTRAGKIISLVDALNRLAQPGSYTPSNVKKELRNVLIELEFDRSQLEG